MSESSEFRLDLRNEPLPSGPGLLELMTSGYLLSSLLFTAVELKIFERLEAEPSPAEALAARLGCSVEGTRRLLGALCAFGLCAADINDGGAVYRNTPLASAALISNAPGSILPIVEHHRQHLSLLFTKLSDGVRTGEPQLGAWPFADGAQGDCYAAIARHPDELKLLLDALDRSAVGVGRSIARQAELAGARTAIDLGGGGAQVAIELAQTLPSLSVTVVDLPATCRIARARVAAAGLDDRVRCVEGDLRRPLEHVAPAEAVILGGVISDFAEPERAAVLANAARVVAPNGQLLVSETLLNSTRTGPALPSLLSLFMLLSTRGDNFTAAELERMLAAAGFRRVKFFFNGPDGLRDLAVARRE